MLFQKLAFLLAACGSGSAALAQRTAVAPLAPVVPQIVMPPAVGIVVATPSLTLPKSAANMPNLLVGRLPDFFTKRPVAAPTAALAVAEPKRLQPIIILNSRLIISYAEFGRLNPASIQKLEIYNEPAKTPPRWSSLTKYGIVSLMTKDRHSYKAQKISSFGRRLDLPQSVCYKLNGQPLRDLSLRIMPEAVAGFDIAREKGAAPVLNIRIVQAWPVPPPAPPGSPPLFYIRGLASSY